MSNLDILSYAEERKQEIQKFLNYYGEKEAETGFLSRPDELAFNGYIYAKLELDKLIQFIESNLEGVNSRT